MIYFRFTRFIGFMCSICLAAVTLTSHVHAAGAAKPISVTDYAGRTVMLKTPAQRIVALAPHIVENLFAAGAGDKIVGVVEYCDYPEQAKQLPKVGAVSTHSMEAIVALKPDLVVVWGSLGSGSVLTQLDALGITTYVSDPHTLQDIARSLRDYGELAGTQKQASQAAIDYERALSSLAKRYSHKEHVSVLYQVWHQPLQTLNDEHIISDVIRLCGGRNSFGDSPTLAPKISVESVIARNPDVIIASGISDGNFDDLEHWSAWPTLTAVNQGHLFFVPPDIIQRHTVRILQGAQLMCGHLNSARKVIE